MPDEIERVEAEVLQPQRGVVIHTPRGPVTAEPGENFMDAIIRAAQRQGLHHIRIFVGDLEVSDPAQAPSRILEGQAIRVETYDPVG